MKIESGAVGMSAERSYVRQEQVSVGTIAQTQAQAAKLDLSREGMDLVEQLKAEKERILQEDAREKKERQAENLAEHLKQSQEAAKQGEARQPEVSDLYKMKLEMLKRMFEALRRAGKGSGDAGELMELRQIKQQYSSQYSAFSIGARNDVGVAGQTSEPAPGAVVGTQWVRTTVSSAFVAEAEHTAFQASGVVKTADGRELNFGVTLEMSRAFAAKYDSISQEKYFVTDPLVINLDANVASVSDQKFLFDIDSDGKKENISFVGKGSGFLALDKNKDGKVNDGSELFGTRSGDGFRDLAAYDEDGNGWIDENDSVWRDLKVWTKDENGKDYLMDLREANVGAIYLGSAQTEFSLNRAADNRTDAIIRKTGVYLKETGEASTIQHLDLTT